MTIIDSQIHAYEANTAKRPWQSVRNWPDHVTGDEMVAAMDAVGVDGAIFVSAMSLYGHDASYAVAVRIFLREGEQDPNHPGLDRILRAAVRHDFPVNFMCSGNLDAGTAVIERHPDARFVLDHLGIVQPRTPPAPANAWADLPKVLALAKRPNVVIKVSGACTLSHKPYPYPDIWDP